MLEVEEGDIMVLVALVEGALGEIAVAFQEQREHQELKVLVVVEEVVDILVLLAFLVVPVVPVSSSLLTQPDKYLKSII